MPVQMGERPLPVPNVPDGRLLTKADVCDLLDVSTRTLDLMVQQGEFPRGVRWGGRGRRWKPLDVTWYLIGRDVVDRLGPDPHAGEDDEDDEAPTQKSAASGKRPQNPARPSAGAADG